MRELEKTRMASPGYRDKINQKYRDRYANDEAFRLETIERIQEERASPEGYAKKRARAVRYYQENKKEIQAKSYARAKADPKLRIRNFMRGRINEALRKHGSSKGGVSSWPYLPYTKQDLFDRLSSEFDPWMNFNNYGQYDPETPTWQVDHIIPQAYFPYSTMDSDLFRWCWDLKNLRPLNAHRNMQEGNREDLLGPVRDIRLILEELKDYQSFDNLKESVDQVLAKLAGVKPVNQSCPMGFAGLNYLDSIFTHRFAASTDRFLSLHQALADDQMVLNAIRYIITKGWVVNKETVYSVLRYNVRTPGHFFPTAAAAILRKYTDSSSYVHDPFLGWGGRSLAALAVGVRKFTGTDLQAKTVEGCRTMHSQVSGLSKTDFLPVLGDALVYLQGMKDSPDFIFTSPPFLSTENYGVDHDSMNEQWIDNFIFPICREFNRVLAPAGHVALHLKDLKGAPTFTAYHSAMLASGFQKINVHRYGRGWTQGVHVYTRK